MADDRTFDTQLSTESESVAVEDFSTGDNRNLQMVSDSSDNSDENTDVTKKSGVAKVNDIKDNPKETNPKNNGKSKPQNESFKVFKPQITGQLISDTILFNEEELPLRALLPPKNSKENKESTEGKDLNQEKFDSKNVINPIWSYQEELDRREKSKEKEFNDKFKPEPLTEKTVGFLVIKEESKSWYKVDIYGEEGYLEKKSVQINALDWLEKSHVQEVGEKTIKSEKQEQLDERFKKKESDKIDKEKKGSKHGKYKKKIIERSKLSQKISRDQKNLKEAKEKFEKKLSKKKKRIEKGKTFKRKSKFTEDIFSLTKVLKKNILSYNELNQFINKEREKLLTEEDKEMIEEYKLKIPNKKEDKKIDTLNPDEIIKRIENKVLMSPKELKKDEQEKKQKKINTLEKKLENEDLDEKEKKKSQEELLKIKSPPPTTKPEDLARNKLLFYANSKGDYQPLSPRDAKALLYFTMKIKTLTKEEEKGLFNFLIGYYRQNEKINEIFGYDGDKINPDAFVKKYPELQFILPSDIVRDELSKNKKAYKKDKKSLRKEHLYPNKNFSIKEFRKKKRARKTEFKEKKDEIKAPRKNLKEESGLLKDEFKSDKKKLKKKDLSKDEYNTKADDLKKEFKKDKKDLRNKKKQNPGFVRGLWQKALKDASFHSIERRLNRLSKNRKENQQIIKQVKENKHKEKSATSLKEANEQEKEFFGFVKDYPDFYLDAYELEHLRKTEGDSEKLKLKTEQFYDNYFKGKQDLKLGFLTTAVFDSNVDDFYELVVLPGLLFKAFPSEYYQNNIPSKPSEVEDGALKFWYKDHFDKFDEKSEVLEETGKITSKKGQVISNIPNDKLNVDWYKFIQMHPGAYWQAYDLQKNLKEDSISVEEKQEQLFEFYKNFEQKFGGNTFSSKEDLWETWDGNPVPFFKQVFPKEYVNGNELIAPTKVYLDFFNALKNGVLDTVKEEAGIPYVSSYLKNKFTDFMEHNWPWLAPIGAVGLAGSDLSSKDSNVFKSLPMEWGVLPGLFTEFVKLDKTFIDNKRSTQFGEGQSYLSHKLRYSNQTKSISPTYPNVPGRSEEFKSPDSDADLQKMFSTKQKNMLPSLYSGLQYDFLKKYQENGETINQSKFSAKAFGQYFTPIGTKLEDREEDDPQTYSLISQMYPFIKQGNYSEFDIQAPWTFGNILGQDKNNTFLNAYPDFPVLNYGLGLSYDQTFMKNFGITSSLNYAAVNAIPESNEFNKLNLWSGKLGTSFKAKVINSWKVDAGLNYNFAYTSDRTPDPDATSQDAKQGIGQSHILSGTLKIGNGFCEFTGSIKNDLMEGEESSTYSFKFSLNQFSDLPKGNISAHIMIDKRAAMNDLKIPSMWVVGGGLVFHLGNILPNQPK